MAVLAVGALLWGIGASPASADSVRDGQWPLAKYDAANKVWPISKGDGVTVAVIDSGVLATHQDLTGQVLAGTDLSGAGTDGRSDSDGHGTNMASLIAGHGHGDQSGVMGLAPGAKILPVRIDTISASDITHSGGSGEIGPGIRFAVDHGAKVINISQGAGPDAQARAAVSYAVSKDVIVVAATGNEGNHDEPVAYPASFPGVVAVGAVDQQGKVWDKSNRGPQVTLVAPGVGIYSAGSKSTSDYSFSDGTSDSTAYVSAIAALIRSKYPNLSAGQVINRMIKSAVPPPDGSSVPDDSYGYGIASPSKALAPNPAVDNGPKNNPLLNRPEPSNGEGSPSAQPAPGSNGSNPSATAKSSSGIPAYVYAIVGVIALLVIVLVVALVSRSRRNGRGPGGPGGLGGPGGQGGPGDGYGSPAPYPSGGPQQYQAQAPQSSYGQQPYPPQQPPAQGNPYGR